MEHQDPHPRSAQRQGLDRGVDRKHRNAYLVHLVGALIGVKPVLLTTRKANSPLCFIIVPRGQPIECGENLVLMNGVSVRIRIGIGRHRRIPHGAEAVVANIKRRCAAHEGPIRLAGLREFTDRWRFDSQPIWRVKRRARFTNRCDAGEALSYTLALLPKEVAMSRLERAAGAPA